MSSWLSLYVRPFDETENYEYNCHGKFDKDNLAMVLMIVSVDVSGVKYVTDTKIYNLNC